MNMKNIRSIVLSTLILAVFAVPAFAQTALTQTTLNGAITTPTINGQPSNQVTLLSGTGVSVGYFLVVDQELMTVTSVANTPTFQVSRIGTGGTIVSTHASGSLVWVIPNTAPQTITTVDPSGSCTASNYQYLPLVNARNGTAWYCSPINSAASEWSGLTLPRDTVRGGRTVVAVNSASATNAYTIKVTDNIVSLSTSGTGSGSLATAINTWTLPSHVGLAGKILTLKDEGGGVTSTTFIAISGTVDGAGGTFSNITLKTAYGGVTFMAGSGGWFTINCLGSLVCK